MKYKFLTIFMAMTIVSGFIPETTVMASETKPSIVEETFTPLEDHTFDNKGYLNIRAITPIGFAGAVCVDLKNTDTGEVQTEKVQYIDSWIGGVWLPEGSYEIVDPRPEVGNYFLVESNLSVVEISHDQKVGIELVVRPNPETLEQFEQAHAAYKQEHGATEPESADTLAPTETVTAPPQTEEVVETAQEETTFTEDTSEPARAASGWIPTLIMTALFVGIVGFAVWIIRIKQK